MRKFSVILVGLLGVVNLSALATLGYYRFVPAKVATPVWCQSGEEYLYHQLGLSGAQIEQMKMIKASFQVQADGISQQLFLRRSELVSLLKTPAVDSQRISQLLHEIGKLQTELQQQVIRTVLKQKAILTPEQQDQFFSLISQRLIYESRCQHASGLNSFDDTCNLNHNQP